MTVDKTTPTRLSPDLSLRATKWADVNAVAQLIYDVCEADGDVTVAQSPQEIDKEWHSDGFDPQKDTCVIETRDGHIVGYGEFSNVSGHYFLNMDLYVHPNFKNQGLFKPMVDYVQNRAQKELEIAPPDLRIYIHSTMDGKDVEMRDVHKAEGFNEVRYIWRMEKTLEEPPSIQILPEGIEYRPFIKDEHSELVWQADQDAFLDHWGNHPETYEEWSNRRFVIQEFDPGLWHIAWDGDQIAGVTLNRNRQGVGWIGRLGVRRSWRGKGLGLSLLQRSFHEFYSRGMKTIGLMVDAQNPTGATRLYQKAGMHVASDFVVYEKELRPGRDAGDLH